MVFERNDVYICNVLKCRPPKNRNPEADEVETCSPFLRQQLEAVRPQIVCCLGTFASQTMLGMKVPISKLRGRFHDIEGIRFIATFHPAYLLRNPAKKREVWGRHEADSGSTQLSGRGLVPIGRSSHGLSMYADVAVCLPFPQTFVYEVTGETPLPARVRVPFKNREVQGFVVGFRKDKPEGLNEIRQVLEVLDPEPLIREDIFELCRWIADYYLAPLGEVLKSAPATGNHCETFGSV